MPRSPRLHVPGGIYHVILRGNHRQPIFFCGADRDYLNDLIAEVIGRFQMRIHAYCWMTNHIHLGVQVSDFPLGIAMGIVAARYARYAQRRQHTTGHLFERRYRAILIDADRYLLALVRYIHLNPVRAGMVGHAEDYRWSGQRAYLGLCDTPWLTTELVLRLFSPELGAARAAYGNFVQQADAGNTDVCLRSGGDQDRRVLGDDRFHGRISAWKNPRRPYSSLDALIQRVCQDFALSHDDLAAPGRLRAPAKARSVVIWHARQWKLASLTELARRFGRSPSTLCETLELYRRTQPELFAVNAGALTTTTEIPNTGTS